MRILTLELLGATFRLHIVCDYRGHLSTNALLVSIYRGFPVLYPPIKPNNYKRSALVAEVLTSVINELVRFYLCAYPALHVTSNSFSFVAPSLSGYTVCRQVVYLLFLGQGPLLALPSLLS